jgi:ABC-2 type transport system ATP-binding protein/lipopolysaccharide transport system ATP-binding protein
VRKNSQTRPAIEIRDVWKSFIIRHNRADSLKARVVGLIHKRYRERREEFWALRAIDLTIERGEALGLMGPNGSGKSTLLRLIARALYPTRGEIIIRGRVAPMIEIGLGFHHELTGRENVYLSASLYGLTRRETSRIYAKIVEFSELEEFIDVPVKNYSTGMYARLGFSIAVHLDPDILLIDEVLAVGDEDFQKKCIERMLEFRRQGRTMLFVSHNPASVEMICDRVCLLSHGNIAEVGDMSHVLGRRKTGVPM